MEHDDSIIGSLRKTFVLLAFSNFLVYSSFRWAQEVLEVVDKPRGRRAGRSGWIVQRYIERPLLVRGRKFDIRLFVVLVADPSTRSWRRRSLMTAETGGNVFSSGDRGCEFETEAEPPSKNREIRLEDVGHVPPGVTHASGATSARCPLTAWCHRDAYVRMSSVKYSNDPDKAKDKVAAAALERRALGR